MGRTERREETDAFERRAKTAENLARELAAKRSGEAVRVCRSAEFFDLVMNPIFDADFSWYSYGFRQGKRAHDTVKQAQTYVQSGLRWVVDMDLAKFFGAPR